LVQKYRSIHYEIILFLLFVGTSLSAGFWSTVKEDTKKVGHEIKDDSKKVGHEIKDGSKKAWKGTKEGSRKAWHDTKEAVK
jgi:hypothetical protein